MSVTPDVDAGEALDTNATTDKEIDSSDEAKNPTEDKSSADEDADDENADEKKEAADDGSTEEDDSEASDTAASDESDDDSSGTGNAAADGGTSTLPADPAEPLVDEQGRRIVQGDDGAQAVVVQADPETAALSDTHNDCRWSCSADK